MALCAAARAGVRCAGIRGCHPPCEQFGGVRMGALQFLSMIANAKEFEARINAFVQVRDEAIKARGEFVGLHKKHPAADAARDGYESTCSSARRPIQNSLHDPPPPTPPTLTR